MTNQTLVRLLALGALGALSAMSGSVRAQSFVDQHPPNVMLLVDSSGSMEWIPGDTKYPNCDSTADQKSRWVTLLEALVGTIDNYHCTTVDRTNSTFATAFGYGSDAPPDYHYPTPYHRPIDGDCTPTPNQSAWSVTSPYAFPANAIQFQTVTGGTCTTSNPFKIQTGSLFQTYGSQVRFGLMTFDTSNDPGTGLEQVNPYPKGVTGTWSYFFPTSHTGHPANCATDPPFEVGARRASAPPWEGRMVGFGAPTDGNLSGHVDMIRKILLATRPYGATPIAGMLDDARSFLQTDTSTIPDPLTPTQTISLGPSQDAYVLGGCRQNYLILLTDGEPNLELQPYCVGGHCPYDKVDVIATDLANHNVKTFVIGFSLAQADLGSGPQDCGTLTTAQCSSYDCYHASTNSHAHACCCLNQIAAAGGTQHAYFASDSNSLRSALSAVMAQVVTGTASRTLPVIAPSSGFNSSARFFTSFIPQSLQLWQGVIERQRYVCEPNPPGASIPKLQTFSRSQGDDFVYRVNAHADTRLFYSVKGAGNPITSGQSIRPVLGNPDGIGAYAGTQYSGTPSNFVSQTDLSALGLTTSDTRCSGITGSCRDYYLNWLVGIGSDSRCPIVGGLGCSVVADVFHSTPAVVGPPAERLQDESYQGFAAQHSTRPAVLYTSTNDGFLHAFKLPTTPEASPTSNNELWAFAPPAVLPGIPGERNGTHVLLLDGAPVVRDVVATQRSGQYYFERAAVGERGSDPITWRTVLVQSFGATANPSGYFALDITDPDPATTGGGPQFLWQLTTNTATTPVPLFGNGTPAPLITSLFFDMNNGADPKEVAVAVLPGGNGGTRSVGTSGTGCATTPDTNNPLLMGASGGPGQLRQNLFCYPAAGIQGRSLTIVRLDNGEIVRTFRASGDPTAGILSTRVKISPLNSPITGQPAAFPGSVGTLATQLYVGDADGVLWRVNVASTNPADWTMKSFFDGYGVGTPGSAFNVGQPIQTAPKISTDAAGHVTVAFSTGDQESPQATTGMMTYVWSLTETAESNTFRSSANWYWKFNDGELATGPLYLFNGGIYYSSFKPAAASSGNACVSGTSAVWGMDYVNRPTGVTALDQGGAPLLPATDPPNGTLTNVIRDTDPRLGAGASIFGVTVAQLPTCGDQVNTTDGYFGSGQHTSVTNVNVGDFQLIMQTGKAGQTTGSQSSSTAIKLALPVAAPRIDSWAAVVEWP
jgi:type IV pilus assembly protein PilY1